jgi:hypothetical protein
MHSSSIDSKNNLGQKTLHVSTHPPCNAASSRTELFMIGELHHQCVRFIQSGHGNIAHQVPLTHQHSWKVLWVDCALGATCSPSHFMHKSQVRLVRLPRYTPTDPTPLPKNPTSRVLAPTAFHSSFQRRQPRSQRCWEHNHQNVAVPSPP